MTATDSPRDRTLVSVVMANFNGAKYLADSIESVRAQTIRDIEIIVSDDASTDNSAEIVRGMMASDPRIRLLTAEKNAGPAAARNRAIDVAAGEWIAVVDSDDLVKPTRLETLVSAAERDSADIVADDVDMLDLNAGTPPSRLLSGRWADAPFWVEIIDYMALNRMYGRGPWLGYLKPIFRASIFRETGIRYDETLRNSEDYDLVLRLIHGGKRMRVYPLPMYIYYRHSNSISHRLREDVLEALLLSELRFFERISSQDLPLRKAAGAKIDSTRVALAYERLLAAVRSRRYGAAIAIALANPKAVVLFRMPIGVRLRRLVQFKASLDDRTQSFSFDAARWLQDEHRGVALSSRSELER
jgi:glycosyltransferase involved in cell wall biosynthesis